MSKYIEVKTLEIAGFASALTALRLPFSLEPRSFINASTELGNPNQIITRSEVIINDKDLALMQTLKKRGPEHAKILRGILVYAEINAPVYWWCECECYKVGRERLSSESTMHTEGKGLSGQELVDVKASIPMGRMLKKVDFFSYQCLRNIVHQRADHRLPEWHEFCEWVETLPFAKELILTE